MVHERNRFAMLFSVPPTSGGSLHGSGWSCQLSPPRGQAPCQATQRSGHQRARQRAPTTSIPHTMYRAAARQPTQSSHKSLQSSLLYYVAAVYAWAVSYKRRLASTLPQRLCFHKQSGASFSISSMRAQVWAALPACPALLTSKHHERCIDPLLADEKRAR